MLNTSSNPNSMSFAIANYEPRPQMPLTLRGVITPANNPTMFKERQRIIKEAIAPKGSKVLPTHKGLMLPGSKSTPISGTPQILIFASGF